MRICLKSRLDPWIAFGLLHLLHDVVAAHPQLARMPRIDPEDIQHSDPRLCGEDHQEHMQHRRRGKRKNLSRVVERRLKQVRQVGLQHLPPGGGQNGDLGQRFTGLDQAVGTEYPLQARPRVDACEVHPQRLCTQQEAGLHQDNRHARQHRRQYEGRRRVKPRDTRQAEDPTLAGGDFIGPRQEDAEAQCEIMYRVGSRHEQSDGDGRQTGERSQLARDRHLPFVARALQSPRCRGFGSFFVLRVTGHG